MKKIFSLLLALVCSVGMWASTETFNLLAAGYSDITVTKAGTNTNGGDMEISKGDIQVTSEKGYVVSGSLTIYAGGSMTVSMSGSATYSTFLISSVEVTYASQVYPFSEAVPSGVTNAETKTPKNSSLSATYTLASPAATATLTNVAGGKTQIKSIVVTYTGTGSTGALKTATWGVNPGSAVVNAEEDVELELTTNYDGTLQFVSNDEGVATVSYNSTSKIITVSGVAEGTTTISVTGAATSTYNAISKSINVTVKAAEPMNNKTVTCAGFGYEYFGLTNEGSGYAQPDEASRVKEVSILTMTIAKADGSTKPRYDDTHIRLYNDNTFTVSVPAGWKLASVQFTEPSSNKGWAGLTAADGQYYAEDKLWYATSDVTSEVFTMTGTNRIGGIIVKAYNANYVDEVVITAAEYATYYNAAKAFTMPAGLEGIVVSSISGNTLSLDVMYTEDGAGGTESIVPAGEPLILHGNAGSYILYAGTTTEPTCKELEMNLLSGTSTADEMTTGGAPYYRLSQHDGKVGFYYGADGGVAFKPGANKAYLALNVPGGAPARFIFGQQDVPTEVVNVNDNNQSTKVLRDGRLYILRDGNMFDLNGRLVK